MPPNRNDLRCRGDFREACCEAGETEETAVPPIEPILLGTLPAELIFLILKFVDARSLLRAERVSSSGSAAVSGPTRIWRIILRPTHPQQRQSRVEQGVGQICTSMLPLQAKTCIQPSTPAGPWLEGCSPVAHHVGVQVSQNLERGKEEK